jgi:hypothetical protein
MSDKKVMSPEFVAAAYKYLREYAQSEQDQLNATEAHMFGIPIKKGEALEITFPSKLWADIMRHSVTLNPLRVRDVMKAVGELRVAILKAGYELDEHND